MSSRFVSPQSDGTAAGIHPTLGCIKLKPAHIKRLFTKSSAKGWPKTLKVA